MAEIGNAVGYADSERTIEHSSLDGSSGRCGEGLLVLTTERRGLPYIYVLGRSRRRVCDAPRGHIGNVRGGHRYLVCPSRAYYDNRQGY